MYILFRGAVVFIGREFSSGRECVQTILFLIAEATKFKFLSVSWIVGFAYFNVWFAEIDYFRYVYLQKCS